MQRNNNDKYCHSTVNMPKYIVLETLKKTNDGDNVTIKTTYIDNFVTVVSNYVNQKMEMEMKLVDKYTNGKLFQEKLKNLSTWGLREMLKCFARMINDGSTSRLGKQSYSSENKNCGSTQITL